MKTVLLSFCLALMLSLSWAQADQEEGFEPLFNGKSLKGWTATTDKPESFFVEDEVLMVKGGRAHLFYTGKIGKANFKNFELKLKAQTTPNSNSGVYFHTEYQEDGWPSVGFEAQVNSTHSDPKKTGSLYGIADVFVPGAGFEAFGVRIQKNGEIFMHREKAPSTDGEWFDYHITVQDERIIIRVNGEVTVDWTQPEGWEKPRRIGHGTVALQAHDPNSTTMYKDIRIKILD